MQKTGKRRQQQMRQQIAAAAARIMAQDGIEDFALAKRKAARQFGVAEAHALPNNEEIEAELRAYQALYQQGEHRDRIRALRAHALKVMGLLAQFRPYLCGPVLKGTAGRYAEIDIKLFTDDSKSVELFLVNREIPYEVSEQRCYTGDQQRGVPALKLDWEGIPLKIAIHCANDERGVLKTSPAGRAIERAGIDTVAGMLADDA